MVFERIRRITRDGLWIPEIDGLRFLAIGSVFLFHLGGELEWRSGRHIPFEPRYWALARVLGNGDRGVRLFFILSGLILALPFARHWLKRAKPVSIRKYYLRRLTRLEPPYLLSILLMVPLIAVYDRGLPPGFAGHVIATMLYQHTLVYGEMSPVNFVTWSLEVEVQFYLIAPAVMQLFRIPNAAVRRGILTAAVFAIGLAQPPLEPSPRAIGSIAFYLQYFLAGLLLADIFVLDLDRIRASWRWDLAGALALVCIFWPPPGMPAHILLPLPMSVLILAAMRGRLLRRAFAAPSIAVIGGMCYSIYLFHAFLIAALFKLTRRLILPQLDFAGNFLIQTITLGVVALPLCTVFYLLIERPCMDPDWPSKLWHRLTGRREAEALDSAGVSD